MFSTKKKSTRFSILSAFAVRRFMLPAVLVVFSACDRPFVAPRVPEIEIIEPETVNQIYLERELVIKVQASSFRDIARIEINRSELVFDESENAWVDTLFLEPGVNTINIKAIDIDDVEGEQNLLLPHLRPQFIDNAPSLPAPWRVAGHTATLLQNGDVLVTGGAARSSAEAIDKIFLLRRFSDEFVLLDTEMDRGRFGHTASLLPDGRVLILGGSTSATMLNESQLVGTAQVYDPDTQTFSNVPFDLPSFISPFKRTGHVTFLSVASGQVFVDVYGGRGPSVASPELLLPQDDIQTFTFVRDTLFFVDVVNGVDGVPPASGLSNTLLSPTPDLSEAKYIVTGTRFQDAQNDSVNFTIDFNTVPIEVDLLPSLAVPRIQHTSSSLDTGLILFIGGSQGTVGTVLASSEVYFDPTTSFFSLDESVATRGRVFHTATKLTSGRILILGGFDGGGQAITGAQYFTWW